MDIYVRLLKGKFVCIVASICVVEGYSGAVNCFGYGNLTAKSSCASSEVGLLRKRAKSSISTSANAAGISLPPCVLLNYVICRILNFDENALSSRDDQ